LWASPRSEFSRSALLRGKDLEARRPPTCEDRLDELARQLLVGHLAGEPRVIVLDRNELDPQAMARIACIVFEHREPHVRPAVVRGASERADIDDASTRCVKALPVDARVRAHDEIDAELEEHAFDERGRGHRLPEELVDLARGAVTEEQ